MLRGFIRLASRLLWPLAAAGRVMQLARRLDGIAPVAVYRDCVRTGATPLEAHIWRSLHRTPHPLPARAAALLMARLGDPEAHILLADKLAAATALSAIGLEFPRLVHLFEREKPIELAHLKRFSGALFVKTRHGHGGRGGFALTMDGGGWRVDGCAVSTPALLERLARLAAHDDLLIQERLQTSPDLTDLAVDGRAPVLRLTTSRLPGAEPVLHAALLAIGVPGHSPRHFLKGAVYVPIDISTGRMTRGLSLARPQDRLESLAWNAAALSGRQLPAFHQAAEAALGAMSALQLPLVHWDLIHTADGPVLLEGNTNGNWIIASLPEWDGVASTAFSQILAKWRLALPRTRA